MIPQSGETKMSALMSLLHDAKRSTLIKQGAEAKVFQSSLSSTFAEDAILLKWRFPKTYRHPTLSRTLTAQRTAQEARGLIRCQRAGASVPTILSVDEQEGILGLEWINGPSIRELLGGGAEGVIDDIPLESAQKDPPSRLAADIATPSTARMTQDDQLFLMGLIGRELAKVHLADVIHGDLTTSNMLLRLRSGSKKGKQPAMDELTSILSNRDKWELVMIDFGLSTVSPLAEDRAVDLYVLERAFASTHSGSDDLFAEVLSRYAQELEMSGKKEKGTKHSIWEEISRKLDEVRLRGRKRSMVG